MDSTEVVRWCEGASLEATGTHLGRVPAWLAPQVARAEHPHSIRAHFGTDKTHNAAHGSDAPDTAAQELDFFFGPARGPGQCVVLDRTSCCIIKPSAIKAGYMGLLVDKIQQRFTITAAQVWGLWTLRTSLPPAPPCLRWWFCRRCRPVCEAGGVGPREDGDAVATKASDGRHDGARRPPPSPVADL